MNLKTAKIFMVACIVLFVGVAVWIGLRNISYFDIKNIEVRCTGPISEVSDDMVRFISPYKGVNLFKAELGYMKHNLLQYEGVDSVETMKYYPDKLIVNVHFTPYKTRVTFEENSQRYFFLTKGDKLEEVSEETFNLFSSLSEVELNPSYAYLLLRWGADNGFAQMCNLAEELARKSLNCYIKYDNNNSNNFGLLTVEMSSPNVVLCVREPVTKQRLSDALDLIIRESGSDENITRFDLYSTALIKRK